MGDTFTESLPLDWLAPYVEQMEASPHIWQILTKRPRRMLKFFSDLGRVPANFWLGVSVIDPRAFRGRMDAMLAIRERFPFARTFASWEPVISPLPWREEDLRALDWLIYGGASGPGAKECDSRMIENHLPRCREYGVAPFVKQLGSNPVGVGDLASRKGSDMREWPLRDGLEHEGMAAGLLANWLTEQPSRAVLYRSAASIARQLGKPEEARKLATEGLRGAIHPEIIAELEEILAEVES